MFRKDENESIKLLKSPLFWKITGVIIAVFLISFIITLFFLTGIFEEVIDPYKGELLLRFQSSLNRIFLVSILIVLFAISLTFLLIETLISPLWTIIKSARQILKGNMRTRIKIETGDELQELAQIINTTTEQFAENLEREKSISRMKSDFLSIAAHQLRTPLSGIKWAIDALVTGSLGEISKEQTVLLRKTGGKVEALILLIKDLLDVVRIEEGKFGYHFTEGQIAYILEQAYQEALPYAEEKNITFNLKPPKKNLPNILFDERNIRYAVDVLIENAINYTLPGGTIDMELGETKKHISVSIKDTGIGIPELELGRLFTKFFRASNAIRMQTEGNGLGLFIVKNVIDRHGGKIMVQSKQGQGSTFFFTLPIPEKFLGRKGKYKKFIEEF